VGTAFVVTAEIDSGPRPQAATGTDGWRRIAPANYWPRAVSSPRRECKFPLRNFPHFPGHLRPPHCDIYCNHFPTPPSVTSPPFPSPLWRHLPTRSTRIRTYLVYLLRIKVSYLCSQLACKYLDGIFFGSVTVNKTQTMAYFDLIIRIF